MKIVKAGRGTTGNLAALVLFPFAMLAYPPSGVAWTWPGSNSAIVGTLSTGLHQRIVRDGAGNAIAVWDTGAAARYTLGGGWSAISGVPALTGVFNVAANGAGDYIAAGISTDFVLRVDLSIGGALVSDNFSISGNLPSPFDPNTQHLKVAISNNNDAIVVWDNGNDIRYRMYRGGSWGADSVLDSGGTVPGHGIDVAADGAGNFIVVWQWQGFTDLFMRRFFSGAWSAREATTGLNSANYPRVAMYGGGEAMMVWSSISGHRRIYARRFNGTSWQSPASIDAGAAAGTANTPQIAVNQNGTIMVAFKQGATVPTEVPYANRYASGAWEGALGIGCGLTGQNFNIDVDEFGNAAAAFRSGGGAFVTRAYQEGIGWLGCAYQGVGGDTGPVNIGSTDQDKKIVITPHEILYIYPRQDGLNPIYVRVGRAIKDVYANGFDTETTDPIVALDVALPYNDICGATSPYFFTEMRFSDDGSNWSAWEAGPPTTPPYQVTRPGWDVTDPAYGGSAAPGLKRVYIQFRNPNCQSLVTHDEIDYTPPCVPSPEVCDGQDNDCDGQIDEGLSTDADGDSHYTVGSCLSPADDCNDADATVYPGAPELCDVQDNDCDGQIDEGLSTDADGDGHYTVSSCQGPADDCDDADASVYPGAPELCDGKDNDCDGQIDEGLSTDIDGDGHYTTGSCQGPADDCNDGDASVYPGAPELCDGQDNDCDGQIDEGLFSADGDGDGHFVPGSCLQPADDCNDADAGVYPGAPELCDGKDNDCDGQIDEGLSTDADGDGHYTTGSCQSPADDCNDGDANIHPGAVEICDGLDNDCDGQIDEGLSTDADGDGHYTMDSCQRPADDCDDGNPALWACNTPVQPDPITFDDSSGVTVTLPNVTSGGDTTISAAVCTDPLPQGIGVTANALCVTVQTTAGFSGQAEVCMPYEDDGTCSITTTQTCTSDAQCPAGEACFDPIEPFLQMVRCPDGDPANCTVLPKSSQDTVNNILCARTDQFSLFAVGELLDSDGDFTPDLLDNCPQVANFFQTDSEVDAAGNPIPDGVGDACDNCTLVANTDQRDTNADGYGNACDADLNGDLFVNTLDFGLFRQAFGASGPNLDADFNGDGIVNTLDFGRFRQMFGAPPGPSGVAP